MSQLSSDGILQLPYYLKSRCFYEQINKISLFYSYEKDLFLIYPNKVDSWQKGYAPIGLLSLSKNLERFL